MPSTIRLSVLQFYRKSPTYEYDYDMISSFIFGKPLTEWSVLQISESCALQPLDKIINRGFAFCMNFEILIAMLCKKYLK